MPSLADLDVLKLRLLTEGVFLEDSARNAWLARFGGPLTLAEYATTSGISIVLPGFRYVNVPIAGPCAQNIARFAYEDERFCIDVDGNSTSVEVIPVAKFHDSTIRDTYDGIARPMSSYGVTHTDRCRVSPIAGCAWKCRFCDLPYELQYRKKHANDLLEVIQAAMDDPISPARHVLISGGTPRGGNGKHNDYDWIDDVYETVARRSPLPVDIMMAPRLDPGHPEWLRSCGVQSLSVNLEISDSNRAKVIMPQKAMYGRANFLKYIERAVEAFGVGNVQSLMVVGSAIEATSSTLAGVRDLVERGCIPVLSPFRAHVATPMRSLPSAGLDEVLEVYHGALDICETIGNGIMPGPRCIACHHNVIAVPISCDFYDYSCCDSSDYVCKAY